jgi:hypothetical protein
VSGRLKIAQRFIAGERVEGESESVKRTTEEDFWFESAVRFTDYILARRYPTNKSVGYFQSSASPTV